MPNRSLDVSRQQLSILVTRAVNDSTLVPAHEYDFGLFPHCDSGTDSMRKCADSTACTDTNACAGTNVGADSNYVARKM